MKATFNRRIFIYFSLILIGYAICFFLYQRNRIQSENKDYVLQEFKQEINLLGNLLKEDNITLSDEAMLSNEMQKIAHFFPEKLRITILNKYGDKIYYDSVLPKVKWSNDHRNRPEIVNMGTKEKLYIRKSNSNGITYCYFAKKYTENSCIRVAYPYNDIKKIELIGDYKNLIIFSVILLLIALGVVALISKKLSKSIKLLRDFSQEIEAGFTNYDIKFENDELGEIANSIINQYNKEQKSKNKISLEREKLIQHFTSSNRGIAFFSKKKEVIYYNTLFLRYINMLTDKTTFVVDINLIEEALPGLAEFLTSKDSKQFEKKILANGHWFELSSLIFDDNTFEIAIQDVTRQEKTRQMKHEMINNIAHELRTPVTSIKGYLETILATENIPDEKKNYFLERAYIQTSHISDLIKDMSLLSKIEEDSSKFVMESVNVNEVLNEVIEEHKEQLQAQDVNIKLDIPENVYINGNKTLIYSIFKNLLENSLAYAGKGIEIGVTAQKEHDDYLFKFYDTGKGVAEQHLSKIFERFYCVNEGRARTDSGSGLGLSIVKNAVIFHHGQISVKNREGGGLVFIFNLHI